MADLTQIRSTIEQIVSQRLNDHVDRLRQQIVEQILREIQPLIGSQSGQSSDAGQPAHQASASGVLNASISAIQESTVQADILKALLEGVSKFSARSALFVVRGTTLASWQTRGFSEENIRGVSIDGSKGLAARAIQGRSRTSSSAAEFDSSFVERQGSPWDGNATVFPLVVKDKVAAVLYCDSGRESGHQSDYSAIELLARHACLWLEHAAVKRHLSPGGETGVAAPVPTPSPSSAGPAATPVSKVSASPAAATGAAIHEPSIDHLPAEEQELHKKAKRFAKLLVDEIKLYNQAKVSEGKQNRDLYRVLREDIEKSRATYDKRYGSTPVAPAKYFDSEVVRVLADNDRSLMGSDFPG